MKAIEPFRPGRTYHWHVFDILRHSSLDGEGFEVWICEECGVDSADCVNTYAHHWRAGSLAEVWSSLLDYKMGDSRYQQIEDSIAKYGFLKPLTASIEGDGYAVFGDGHHRIAAALELHIDVVPVRFFASLDRHRGSGFISEDSGCWRAGSPITV